MEWPSRQFCALVTSYPTVCSPPTYSFHPSSIISLCAAPAPATHTPRSMAGAATPPSVAVPDRSAPGQSWGLCPALTGQRLTPIGPPRIHRPTRGRWDRCPGRVRGTLPLTWVLLVLTFTCEARDPFSVSFRRKTPLLRLASVGPGWAASHYSLRLPLT